MNRKLQILVGLPKTIYFNLCCFDFKTAIRLPILLSHDVKLGKLRKGVIILNNFSGGGYHINFGIGGSDHVPKNDRSYLSFGPKARIIFNGRAIFGEGTRLRCDYGRLEVGKNFSSSKNCCINCEYNIKIGDNVLLGWDIYLRDTDGHDVFEGDRLKLSQKNIIIGNHVWIGSFAHLLKGVVIKDDTVVAWRSCVLKAFDESNLLIGGYPAKVLKNNYNWGE